MVAEDRTHNEGQTEDDRLAHESDRPTTVEWYPEWDDPEERPGENTRIDDETLIWERDGFTVRLTHHEALYWRAVISLPASIGRRYERPIDLQTVPFPEYGTVTSVDVEDHVAQSAELLLAGNYQPIWELNNWIDYLLDSATETQTIEDDPATTPMMAGEHDE